MACIAYLPLAWIAYPSGVHCIPTSGVHCILVSECSLRRESPMIELPIPASRDSGLRQKLGTRLRDGQEEESGRLAGITWQNSPLQSKSSEREFFSRIYSRKIGPR